MHVCMCMLVKKRKNQTIKAPNRDVADWRIWRVQIASLCNEITIKIVLIWCYFYPLNPAKCLWDLVTQRPPLMAFRLSFLLLCNLMTNVHFNLKHFLSLLFYCPLVKWWPHPLALCFSRFPLHWLRSCPTCNLPSLFLNLIFYLGHLFSFQFFKHVVWTLSGNCWL